MPNPKFRAHCTPRQWEYLKAVKEYGSQAAAAEVLGVNKRTLERALAAIDKKVRQAGEFIEPRILLCDLETAPNAGYAWGKWEQNILSFTQEWYILCFAYKWLGKKKVHAHALPDFRGYKPRTEDDSEVVKKLWDVFDEADIIVAHNGDRFDIKKSNARFIFHDMPPPSPYKTVDTLKVAKQKFQFTSNKLDDLGDYLNVGRKIRTGGFDLWLDCMAGEQKAWKKMVEYNKQDVRLLERVYLKMRPWMTNHPNRNTYTYDQACPSCGSKNLTFEGHTHSQVKRMESFRCDDCGAWSKGNLTQVGVIRP